MGCCVSTTTKSSKAEHHHNPLGKSCDNSEAPSLLLEEETVKEVVLSETPLPKPPTLNENMSSKIQDSEVEEVKNESTAVIKPTREFMAMIKYSKEIISEVSEHSEICSLTESFSTATAPEKRDDDGEVTQRSPVRVPRKPRNSGEVAVGRDNGAWSPSRRPAPAREMRGQLTSSRAGQERQITAQRRIVEPENGFRRESGEGSCRRLRSPVTSRKVGMRQNGRYNSPGGRSPARKVDNAGNEEQSDEDVLPESCETLENPVVSLECFIFL